MLTLVVDGTGNSSAPVSPIAIRMEDFGTGLIIIGGVVLVVSIFLIIKRKLG